MDRARVEALGGGEIAMHLVVVMMLGICVPSIAPPARATGGLTDGERLFQGVWQLNSYGSDSPTGTLRIEDRDFRADGVHGRYTGYVSIRSDTSPAQINFTIENCECKFDGMTSTAIYYEDDGTIVFAAPAPGEPRPKAFTGLDVTRVMLERATRPVEGDGEEPR